MICREFEPWLQAFVDGELDVETMTAARSRNVRTAASFSSSLRPPLKTTVSERLPRRSRIISWVARN